MSGFVYSAPDAQGESDFGPIGLNLFLLMVKASSGKLRVWLVYVYMVNDCISSHTQAQSSWFSLVLCTVESEALSIPSFLPVFIHPFGYDCMEIPLSPTMN